ncbi:Ribonuclease VapC42 [Methylobacterium cerastii]|uniref:Ribonuclease VapC n=1 Tax=Methylobacterium cerastii TaxID=932741 RepID=A0ABQ4QM71_9HYPH|nr:MULTISPECIES: type II toxin-antitoxin system VapC family toxin [Methylobacterium]TXM97116.1 type II toxin-antitoxin system VapC family toxin [Methylobacterium sp. WL122]TXN83198.1 type II toxin-antitoxin system VapC family toxin [Methylobacterium sp. WL8]GJD46348.1 Ribonuclease VapC42 [Methylobacterium cerastii]
MFVDASALVAILAGEPGNASLARAIKAAHDPITSALAIFETASALARKNALAIDAAETETYAFLDLAGIRIVALGDEEVRDALAAYARFGKGRGHPARLNMGDCFAYACARVHDVPLLFVGDDFPQTDIHSAAG